MLYLIDGYNLLHALGIKPKTGPAALERARSRLLGHLWGALGDDEAPNVTVIFDAGNARPDASAEQQFRGIQVRFAVGEYEADDLIEKLIKQASVPKNLTVVSDDHRIQDAARRRRCASLSCALFIDYLQKQKRPPSAEHDQDPGKPESSSRSDTQHWLKEFADLEKDPDMKAAFNPFDFEPKDVERDWRGRPQK